MPHLFDSYTLRGVTLRNRIVVSPMCEYSSEDGFPNDWHMVHLGSRAVGGAGLVLTEATAVEARGRISPQDAGIWSDAQADAWAPIARFISDQGAVPGIQLAHAGRKGSTSSPWEGGHGLTDDQGGWEPVGPSAIAFADDYRLPYALAQGDIREIQDAFVAAALRAVRAGFRWIEVHAAHGYLIHEFLSPLSNHREDEYGGSFDNRIRILLETVAALRAALADDFPLTVRISSTDWVEGGWTLSDSIALARRLKAAGVDLIDCSTGGNVPDAKIPVGAGYQVPFAESVRRDAEIATAAVGMITEPMQADELVRNGRADLIVMARELLRDPYWPLHAASVLHQKASAPIPVQYARAF